MENNSGIYKITNIVNGKFYIGSSINIKKRWTVHINHLRKNKHCNRFLQASFLKHGEENFKFDIIEFIQERNSIVDREQHYTDLYKSYINGIGYNIATIAGSPAGLGNKCKGTRRPFMQIKYKGNGNPFFGKVHSEEAKKKWSDSKKGNNNPFFGKTHSEEFKQKSSKIHKGKLFSKELRNKLSAAGKGRKQSDEHIKNRISAMVKTKMANK